MTPEESLRIVSRKLQKALSPEKLGFEVLSPLPEGVPLSALHHWAVPFHGKKELGDSKWSRSLPLAIHALVAQVKLEASKVNPQRVWISAIAGYTTQGIFQEPIIRDSDKQPIVRYSVEFCHRGQSTFPRSCFDFVLYDPRFRSS